MRVALGVGSLLVAGLGSFPLHPVEAVSTAIIFPSRVSTCRAQRAAWSALKLGAVLLDEEAQQEGPSTALDGQTWSVINHRSVTGQGIPWPEVCRELDEVIEFIIEQVLTFPQEAVERIGAFLDEHVQVLDGDASRFRFEELADKYAGAALVAPYAIIIPGCVQPPRTSFVRAHALDLGLYVDRVLGLVTDAKACVSCLARVVAEVVEIIRGAPADLDTVENIVSSIIDSGRKVAETLQAMQRAGTLPTTIGGLMTQILPDLIGSIKAEVGDDKATAFLSFLNILKDEIKNEDVPRIDNALEKYLKAQGC